MENRNYNEYLSGMAKGDEDKLFFLNKINLNDYSYIIDFGCGGGDILTACIKATQGKKKYFAIDNDPYMREIEIQKFNRVIGLNYHVVKDIDELTKALGEEGREDSCTECIKKVLPYNIPKILIIFSSVLHEVGNYWVEIKSFLMNYKPTIVVRDMCTTMTESAISKKEDIAKIIRNSNPQMLADFVERYGSLYKEKNMYHYLLKYTYVSNWEVELKENYFSFDYKDLYELIYRKIIFQKHYILEYKKDEIKRNFNIDLEYPTHIKLIANI